MKLGTKTEPKVDSSSTDPRLIQFQQERELGRDIIEQAGLYYVDGGKYDGMLAIPYQRRCGGDPWQTRYRTGHDSPKYLDEEGANLHLYNPQFIGPHSDEVWFTEGEIDALTLWEHGLPAVGISGNTKYGTPEFRQAFSLLFSSARVFMAVDMDAAGDVCVKDLKESFPQAQRLIMPDGMDVNDWHKADRAEMEAAIERLRQA